MSKSSFRREASPLTGITPKASDTQSELEELKRARDELAFINKLNRIITSSLDINQVNESFIEELRRVVDVDWATIVLIEGDKLRFFALSTRIGSLWRQGEVIPLEGTATQWVARHKQTLMEPDLSRERKFWTGEYHLKQEVRSIIYLPLILKNEVFGALIIASRRPNAYGERELSLLEHVAKQIANPIENARLYEENKRRQDLLQSISHLTRIITSDADITQVYETFVQELKKLVPFDHVSISLREGDKVRFLAVSSTVPTEIDAGKTIPLEGSVLQWLTQHKQTNIENDFLKERRFPVDELHLKSGLRSAIRVPLVAEGEVFGSLNLTSSKPDAYNEWHKEVLEQLSAQVSGAINNARLYQLEKTLKENIADIIFLMDLKGNITYMSKNSEEETKYTRAEVEGKNIKELLTPESYKIASAGIKKRLKGMKGTSTYEVEVKAKDGSAVPFELNTSTVMTGDELTGIQIVARNISERRRQEELLREVFENAQVGTFIVQNGKFKYVNTEFENLSGYTKEELLGRPSLDLAHPEDREKVRENAIKMLKGERAQSYEYRTVRKDKQIAWIMERVISIKYQGKRATLGSYMDITARKQEEEVRLQFTKAITHELSTPLTPILSSGKLLVEQLEPKGGIESRLAKNILDGAHTLSNRLNELLELTKGEMGLLKVNPEPLESESLIRRLADRCSTMFAAKKQGFHLELESPLPYVLADEERTSQVLLNLLSNANKYTPEGGRVTVRAKAEVNALAIEVEDNGPGIPPEKQAVLFQPYSQSNSSSGLGLGLAISKQLVELQGGKIWCQSQPGSGSTFGFSLPLASSQERK
jgi:PAS domain S-box-containing protein